MDREDKDKDYSVGYKRPPQHTQFKPGQSGNPKGRPKNVPTMNELLLKELLSRVRVTTPDGRRRMVTKMELIAKQVSNNAVKGDLKSAKLVLEQLNASKSDSGDNIANLLQEFRIINARNEAADFNQLPAARVRPKKRK